MQNIGKRFNALITLGKSLVEINMWKLWPSKIYSYIGKKISSLWQSRVYQSLLIHNYISCLCNYFLTDFASEVFMNKVTVSCYNVACSVDKMFHMLIFVHTSVGLE